MSIEVWVAILVPTILLLLFVAYRYRETYSRNLVPILQTVIAVAVVLVIVFNLGVSEAKGHLNDHLSKLPIETRIAVDLYETLDPAYVPMRFLALLAVAWVFVLLLTGIPMLLQLDQSPEDDDEHSPSTTPEEDKE